MKKCHFFEKQIVLSLYDELDEKEQLELQAHLHACKNCKAQLEAYQQFRQEIPEEPIKKPDENGLIILRNLLSLKIKSLLQTSKARDTKTWRRHLTHPGYVVQTVMTVLLLLIGFQVGRHTQKPESLQGINNTTLATNTTAQTNQRVRPLFTSVENINFDEDNGSVGIQYTVVNQVEVRGNLENPNVRQMLQFAMQDKENPAIRLHAVKAIKTLSHKKQTLEPDLVASLETLLESEENLGVRLQAIRLIKVLPFNPTVQKILTRVLLFDPAPAMRIEAFNTLTSQNLSAEDATGILNTAKEDTNAYLKNQSLEHLLQLKGGSMDI